MRKLVTSLLFVVILVFSGFAYAEKAKHVSETLGRALIDASVSGTDL